MKPLISSRRLFASFAAVLSIGLVFVACQGSESPTAPVKSLSSDSGEASGADSGPAASPTAAAAPVGSPSSDPGEPLAGDRDLGQQTEAILGPVVEAAKGPKVSVCHVPPGNPANRRVINVGESAVAAHLAHGDNLFGDEVCDGLDNDCDGVVDNGGDALCDDSVGCTVDVCGGVAGCANTPTDALCDDGEFCNGAEACDAELDCQPGTPPDCDNGEFCDGSETCEEANDQCVSPGDPCGDNGEFCDGTESCNETADQCVFSGDPCDDNDEFCDGTESCDETADQCVSSGDPCGDNGEFCDGTESCDEANDQCESSGDPCGDNGEFCDGTESCDEAADQCVSSGDPCPLGELCSESSDTCESSGSCAGGVVVTYSATPNLFVPGTEPATPVMTTINVPDTGTICDINVVGVTFHTPEMGEGVFDLTDPSGAVTRRFKGTDGGVGDGFTDITFDDEAVSSFPNFTVNGTCFTGNSFTSLESLSGFDGMAANGAWTLTVTDVNPASQDAVDCDCDGFNVPPGLPPCPRLLETWGLEITISP